MSRIGVRHCLAKYTIQNTCIWANHCTFSVEYEGPCLQNTPAHLTLAGLMQGFDFVAVSSGGARIRRATKACLIDHRPFRITYLLDFNVWIFQAMPHDVLHAETLMGHDS